MIGTKSYMKYEGKEMIELLDYDTRLFGYKVGKIYGNKLKDESDLLKNIELAKLQSFRLIYLFLNEDSIDFLPILEKLEIKFFIDKKILLLKKLNPKTVRDIEEVKIYSENKPNSELISLALKSGLYSRFRLDPNFSNNEFVRLYIDWITKSVSREISDYILIYTVDRKICGFLSLKILDDFSKIGLISVDENFRGKGIGKKLIGKAEYISLSCGREKVFVSTQERNREAVNFYKGLGFEISETEIIVHIWLK
jgi:dTDP-4-amino-4,6-dideoxy-D-galactose acyltransferase